MSQFRQYFVEEVLGSSNGLNFSVKSRVVDGLLRIDVTLPGRAFNYRNAIDTWMFDCTMRALKASPDTPIPPLFRGVDERSRDRALKSGIDVEPPDMHWYGASLDKALEDGGDYPAVLIIDGACAQRPFRSIAINASESAHSEARQWALGEPVVSKDGRWLQYSRLPLDDSRRGSGYEAAYSWFIPGDPREALLGIIDCRAAGDHD